MWIDYIIGLLVMAALFWLANFLNISFSRAITSQMLEKDGYIFVRPNSRPIFFKDSAGGNIFIRQSNEKNVRWAVWAVDNGVLKFLGDSQNLLLG